MKSNFTPKEKSEIVKQHFLKSISIEDICNTYQITPSTFEKWKTILYENSDLVFKQSPDDGMDYYQNYDLVINWLSQAFKGQTLKVLGIDTAPIKRVCSFKPVEIAVNTGIIDVIFEDENEKCYHLEEQRHMGEPDLYRFASQHFSVANEWRDDVIDIILISGRSYNGKRKIKTHSGLYQPTFVDFTERNGKKRFKQIREAIESGDSSSLLELAFLPMYGNDKDLDRKKFVEEIIQFETELLKKDPTKDLLVTATLIMSNKILDQETFHKLWEEIKMIKAFKFAEEIGYNRGVNEGYDKGNNEGYDKGALNTAKMMLIEIIEETLGIVPEYIDKKIQQISSQATLKGLLRQAIKCDNIKDFDQKLALAI
ncbi:Transposase IS3/IS911 [Candidatus Magnetomorum sp. HK-1]|nr:Transposase IS3/IS911 [Candidatus Magnetomorum sp. HK-1]